MNIAVVALAALMAAPTLAPDLEGYLEGSAEADFHGEMLVDCATPDGRRDTLFDIAQVDGSVVAWSTQSGEPVVAVTPGQIVTAADGSVGASVDAATTDVHPAYDTEETDPGARYLGRPASVITVRRDGVERLHLTVDDATGVVLRTTTFTADGDEYCNRRLLSFEEGAADVPEVDAGDTEPTQPLDDAPAQLPDEAAGFALAETYPVEAGTLSYYSDGFFSFGVVVTDRPIGFDDEADVTEVTIAGDEYRRSYQAGRVTVAWTVGSENLALIGDLPPDLTEAVVARLPKPADQGFFGRLWHSLFGFGQTASRL